MKMKQRTGSLVMLPILALASSAFGAETLAEWEIHDSLGHEWTDELLFYDLDLKKPISAKQPLSLVDGEGKAVAVQMVEPAADTKGKVNHIRIALITGLKPFGQRRFVLSAGESKASATDLSCKKEGDRWVLATSKIGISIPSGPGKAATLAQAPAPILSIRGAGSDWVGKGWSAGTTPIASWKTEIVASGPVFAWARVTYNFSSNQAHRVDIRLPAGQPVVLVRQETEADGAKDDAFKLALGAGLKPTHVLSSRQGAKLFVEAGADFKGSFVTPTQRHWDPSCCKFAATWKNGDSNAPVLGVFPRFLSKWRPVERVVPVAWDKDSGLVATFPIARGATEWGLMAGPKNKMVDVNRPFSEADPLSGRDDALWLQAKWGETPLDKVKDWVLDWGDYRYDPAKKYQRAPDALDRGMMLYFAEQYLLTGQHWINTMIHRHQTWTGEGDAWEKYTKHVQTISEEQRLSDRAGAAFVEYKQDDPDYWRSRPDIPWLGPSNANMIYMGNSAMLLGAQALRDHPTAKQWTENSLKIVRQNLSDGSLGGKGWIECPGYDGAGINPIVRAAIAVQQSGLGDLLSDGMLLGVAMYQANLVTPPDPRVHNFRHLPEYGDCFDLQTDKNAERGRPTYWNMLIPFIKDKHPRETGQILWALGETNAPVPLVPIQGESHYAPSFGSVFRHGFNTPNESYVAIHNDSIGYGHYHFDLGALYFFGKGAPLCVDWPSMYSPQMNQWYWHNSVCVAKQPRFNYKGRVPAQGMLPRADYVRSRAYYDGAFPPSKEGEPQELPPHCWQRQLLFVKSADPAGATYLVTRDALLDERPTDWNLWTLSNKLRLQKKRADVTGTYGVDMAVAFFVGPDQVPATEMAGFGKLPDGVAPGGDAVRNDKGGGVTEVDVPRKYLMQQNVVRMSSGKGGQYGAVLYPYRSPQEQSPMIVPAAEEAVTVTTGPLIETIFLYPTERTATVGDIHFEGRAALVSRSGKNVELHLLEGKSLSIEKGPSVSGPGPVSRNGTMQ